MLSFPAMLVALLIDGVGRAMFPNAHDTLAFAVLVFAIALSGWVKFARTVRGSTLVERNKEYVQAARVIGVSSGRIMARHVLPNVMGPVLVLTTIDIGQAILAEATLSFLGVGVPPTTAVARHPDPHRQRLPVLGRVVDHDLPRRHAGAHRAVGEPAGRLAARRAQPPAALMTGPLLQVRHLKVEFPTRRGTLLALDDISFDIAPGEILGVVGESGAGKSLTGAAIIGLLEPPGARRGR